MTGEELIVLVTDRMKEKGISIYRLAQISGVTRAVIGKWLNKGLQITSDNLLKVLEVLDIEIGITEQ